MAGRRQAENGGYAQFVFAATDQRGFRPAAQHQPERIEQNRLAGAGFPRQHAETGRKFKIQPVDEHYIADGQ